MKAALLFTAAILFIAASCGNRKKGDDATAARKDSVEYKVTFVLTRPDPPYDDYDTTFTVKFATSADFIAWSSDVNTKPKSFEKVK